ncbi:hypothetical protein ACFWA5_11545 [Streptomyces mirabilis]|uniref:hypothetical protein n=1 Tax=Streptomyces mirabilis TaxID=68239 RepID=UPI00366567BC
MIPYTTTRDTTKKTSSSVAEARRELGQQTVAEYAKQRRPRQRTMTEYSTGEHVYSSVNVHIIPRLGSRKLNSVGCARAARAIPWPGVRWRRGSGYASLNAR